MIQSCGFFLLRAPALSVNRLANIATSTLRLLGEQPYVQEAIRVASPEFYDAFTTWLNHGCKNESDSSRIEHTFLKYLIRMCFRPTPFGLFSGVSMGLVDDVTRLQVAGPEQSRFVVRIDADYLCRLAKELERDTDVQSVLVFFPNSTLYRMGQQLCYVEHVLTKNVRSHQLVTVDSSPWLEDLLDAAATGVTLSDLEQRLTDADIELEEAKAFINELVESQVLVSELEPMLTGPDYLRHLVAALQKVVTASPLVEGLRKLDAAVTICNQSTQQPLHKLAEGSAEIRVAAQNLGITFDPGQLLQVDLALPVPQATLDASTVSAVAAAIQFLATINPVYEEPKLAEFKQAFYERYEAAEVPLAHVLDPEVGLGYPVARGSATAPMSLVEGLDLPKPSFRPKGYALSSWDKELLGLYTTAIRDGEPIRLSPDLAQYRGAGREAQFPASLFASISLLPSSSPSEQNFRVLYRGAKGPSCANFMGRFCYLDAGLTARVSEALQAEAAQYPNAVLAEVLHLNQARTGNISTRPQLRSYEIPLGVQASVDSEHRLELSDLLLSVRGDRLVLRSAKLNKEVVPRMSTAHNHFFNTLPAYHFLCDLQYQGEQLQLGWTWGPLETADFLPRVELGAVILSRARWIIRNEHLQLIAEAPHAQLLSALDTIRKALRLPRWITVKEHDNELPLDLTVIHFASILQTWVRKLSDKSGLQVEEWLFEGERAAVYGPDGPHTNEMLLPFANPTFRAPESAPNRQSHPATTRVYPLGSEWVYAKLYCGNQTADDCIFDVISPLAEQLYQEGIIDKWFFVRYADPHPHLRVRFHGEAQFYAEVLARLHIALEPLIAEGRVANVVFEVYKPEYARYGTRFLAASETIFHHDSVAAAQALAVIPVTQRDEFRWQAAAVAVDTLLTDFGFELPSKLSFFDSLQRRSKEEFTATTPLARKSLANKFRGIKPHLAVLLAGNESVEMIPLRDILGRKSAVSNAAIQEIKQAQLMGELGVDFTSLVESHVHMLFNRWLLAKHRLQEMVLYDSLFKFYESCLARQKKARIQ